MKDIDFFSPLWCFPLIYSLFYGPGVLVIGYQDFPQPLEQRLLWLVSLGLVSFVVGVMLSKELRFRRSFVLTYRVAPAAMLLIFVGYFLTLLIGAYILLTNTDLVLGNRDFNESRTLIIQRVGAPLLYLFRTNAIFFLLCFIFLNELGRMYGLGRTMRPIAIVMFFVSAIAASFTGYRINVLILVLSTVILYNMAIQRIKLRSLIVLFTLSVLFLVGYGALRIQRDVTAFSLFGNLALESYLPAFNTIRVIEDNPQFHGRYLLNAFLTLLPGEQVSMGLLLKERLGLNFEGGGFAPSILGGLYIDFGFLGTIMGMFLLGMFSGIFYRVVCHRKTATGLVAYSFWMSYLLFAIRGGLLSEIYPVICLLIIFGAHLLLRIRWEAEPGHLDTNSQTYPI